MAALAALLLPPLMLVLAVVVTVQEFPRVLFVFGLLVVAMAAIWYALLRRGAVRMMGFAAGILALAATVILLVNNGDNAGAAIVIVAGLALAIAAAKTAMSYHAPLPDALAPADAVLSTTRSPGAARRRSSTSPRKPASGASSRSS